jgi:hypothetical protein
MTQPPLRRQPPRSPPKRLPERKPNAIVLLYQIGSWLTGSLVRIIGFTTVVGTLLSLIF